MDGWDNLQAEAWADNMDGMKQALVTRGWSDWMAENAVVSTLNLAVSNSGNGNEPEH